MAPGQKMTDKKSLRTIKLYKKDGVNFDEF